jgi:hypothetical protein
MELRAFFFLVIFIPGVSFAAFIVCDESGIQLEPVIGFDGVNYLVVWNDGRGALSKLYGARVAQTGVVLDTGGVGLLNEFDLQAHPSIAFDGNNFLVAWQFGC